ncbi:MAG: hypothetical protein HY658_13175 [Actinobacteria bacterium]|nr:hypothetical protein [Actinomycetota bacterium]
MSETDERVREALARRAGGFEPSQGTWDRFIRRVRGRQRARRVGAATVALGLFAGVVGGGWLLVVRGPDPTPLPGRALTVDVGGAPIDLAADAQAMWVSAWTAEDPDDLSGEIVRVDPVTGEIEARIALEEVGAVAAGEGAVWTTNLRARTVTRIDPATDEIVSVIPLPPLRYEVAEGDRDFVPNDVAVGFGRVWVSTARGSVVSIDPATEEVLTQWGEPGLILGGIEAGAGGVWTWNSFTVPEAAVLEIDPRTGQITERIVAPGVVHAAAAGPEGLWVVLDAPVDCGSLGLEPERCPVPAIVRIDARTQGVAGPAPGGGSPGPIAVAADAVFVGSRPGAVYRIDPDSMENEGIVATVEGVITGIAAISGAVWVAVEEGLVRLPLGDLRPTPEPAPTPTLTVTPSPAHRVAGVVPTGACAFPAYRPTYLPWLGERRDPPFPDSFSRSFEGGGPQGFDPGYSILAWTSPGADVVGVHMWRSTESVGAIPAEPGVPELPDGSEGRVYETEGGTDVAIIWTDAFPSIHDDECGETLLGVSIDGASAETVREELFRVARSLEPLDWDAEWPPSNPDGSFAVWPEDTPEGARGAAWHPATPGWRYSAWSTALEFARRVLRWDSARLVDESGAKAIPDRAAMGTTVVIAVEREEGGPTADVELGYLAPEIWSVTGASGPPVQVTVTRDDRSGWMGTVTSVPYEASVEIRFGYGEFEELVRSAAPGGGVTVPLGRFETNVPGHLIVLFLDEAGRTIAVTAMPLPPGNARI